MMRHTGKITTWLLICLCISCEDITHRSRLNESELEDITASFFNANSNILGSLHRIDRKEYKSWNNSLGYTDLSRSESLEPDDLFAIGSITKTFTATIILQLMEEGSLHLDSLIVKYLPDEFKTIIDNMEYGQFIRVLHLLKHTSGIYSYTWIEQFFEDKYADLDHSMTPVDIMNYVTEYGWFVNYPGYEYHYSNTNYLILGVMIEHITGISYAQNLEQRIIQPLELENTFLAEGMLNTYNVDIIHGYDLDYGEVYDIHEFNFDASSWAAGGIISNTTDLNIFISALFKRRLFMNNETFPIMIDMDDLNFYGLGIFVREHPGLGYYYGHGGGHQGTNSIMFYIPSIQTSISACITINGQGGYVNPEDELTQILEILY